MADFQDGLAETGSRLALVISKAEEAHFNVQRLQSEAVRIRQQIDDAWSGLSDRSESLHAVIENIQSELIEESETALQAISQLHEKVNSVQNELESDFDETHDLVTALISKVNELRTDFSNELTDAENAVRSLVNQSIGSEVDLTAANVSENLANVDASIDSYQQSVEAKAELLGEFVNQHCLPELEMRATACNDHISAMFTDFQGQLDSMKTAAREQIERIFQLVSEGQTIFADGNSQEFKGLNDLSDEIRTLTGVLEGFMQRLSEALLEGTSHVATAAEKHVEVIDETIADFQETHRQLQDVKETLERY